MTKFTDSQLIVLSSAAAREGGVAVLPPRMPRAAALKVGSSLVARKLMREVRAKAGMPVWREDEEGGRIALVITKAGRSAIGVEDETAEAACAPGVVDTSRNNAGLSKQKDPRAGGARADKARDRAAGAAGAATSAATGKAPREGSKQALVIGMLEGKAGASLVSLVTATGWLPHTTRAALTGLRKKGYVLERTRSESSGTVYRIAAPPAQAA
jgi:hypothetical protein